MTDSVGEVYAFTGHRPDKLGGYDMAVMRRLTEFAQDFLVRTRPSEVISGMALGWDTAVARAAIRVGTPLLAAVPFVGQERRWPAQAQETYHAILRRAQVVKVVCPGGYDPAKMHKRNAWMVDNSTTLIALWDGTDGGTAGCVRYAKSKNHPTVNIWKEWQKYVPL